MCICTADSAGFLKGWFLSSPFTAKDRDDLGIAIENSQIAFPFGSLVCTTLYLFRSESLRWWLVNGFLSRIGILVG
jgi:hypothetical protein